VKKFQLFLSFYKSIAFANIVITLATLSIIFIHGINPFLYIFWFKIFTLFIVLYANDTYKKNEYFYYLNFGVSKKSLWISSVIIDTFIFIILLIITLKIR